MAVSRVATFDDEKHCWRVWNRRSCLEAVKLACDECGEAVTVHEFDILHLVEPHIYPCVATVRQYVGWAHAIQAAGYEPNSRGRRSHRDYEGPGNDDLSSLYFN